MNKELPIVDEVCDCRECINRTSETYTLDGWCINCGQRFLVRCRKGDRAPLFVDCPHCECSSWEWWR